MKKSKITILVKPETADKMREVVYQEYPTPMGDFVEQAINNEIERLETKRGRKYATGLDLKPKKGRPRKSPK
jgi:hypothetical protein